MMDRRELLRGLGTAAAAALMLAPEDARAAWARVASHGRPAQARRFTDAQLALVATLGDLILPRTDTPGAVDVGVPAFVEALVGGSWPDDDRTRFLAGLDALHAHLGNATGSVLSSRIDEIERQTDRGAEPVRTYWRLKSLIVHGYFTSAPVMKNVLHVQVIPGRFDGAAPMPATRTPARDPGAGAAGQHHG